MSPNTTMLEVHCQAVSWERCGNNSLKTDNHSVYFYFPAFPPAWASSLRTEDRIDISLQTIDIEMRKRRRTPNFTRWANIPFVSNVIFALVYRAKTIRFAFSAVLTSGDAAWTAVCYNTMMINHDRSDDGIKLIRRCWQQTPLIAFRLLPFISKTFQLCLM